MTIVIETLESTKDRRFGDVVPSDLLWVDSIRNRHAHSAPHHLSILSAWVYSQYAEPHATDTQLHSLMRRFANLVSHLPEIERIFWKLEDDRVRVWTIIDQPSLATETQIYDAQLEFMDRFPEFSFDFAVIFRQGKNPDQIHPAGAAPVFSRT